MTTLEDFFEFVTEPEEEIRFKGRRIDLSDVVYLFRDGMAPERIADYFSCPLEPLQVYVGIAYYLNNKDAVDAYMARAEAAAAERRRQWEANRPPGLERLREIKARLQAEAERDRVDFLTVLRRHAHQPTPEAAALQ